MASAALAFAATIGPSRIFKTNVRPRVSTRKPPREHASNITVSSVIGPPSGLLEITDRRRERLDNGGYSNYAVFNANSSLGFCAFDGDGPFLDSTYVTRL